MRKSTKLFGALAVAGLVAASGSAFTASNTVAASVAGYGTNEVTGAIVSSVHHTLAADGVTIVSTDLVFTTSQLDSIVTAGFGDTAVQSCVVDPEAGDPLVDPKTATCTYNPAFNTALATDFNVAVVADPTP